MKNHDLDNNFMSESKHKPHEPLWSVSIGTLFPHIFPGSLAVSCSGKAMMKNIFDLHVYDLREYGIGKHKLVDDAPFGGGAGMVMRPDVIDAFFNAHENRNKHKIYLSPRGRVFTQAIAHELIQKDLCILCGRYEGVDQRVLDHWSVDEISIGDFVTFGGEIPAMAMLEACIRLLPGVIEAQSIMNESFEGYLLEHHQYTRPSQWKPSSCHDTSVEPQHVSKNNTSEEPNSSLYTHESTTYSKYIQHMSLLHSVIDKNTEYNVPCVLLSGNHKAISQWRLLNSIAITKERRQDLWSKYIYHVQCDELIF